GVPGNPGFKQGFVRREKGPQLRERHPSCDFLAGRQPTEERPLTKADTRGARNPAHPSQPGQRPAPSDPSCRPEGGWRTSSSVTVTGSRLLFAAARRTAAATRAV